MTLEHFDTICDYIDGFISLSEACDKIGATPSAILSVAKHANVSAEELY